MLRRTALTGLGVGVLLVAATRGARAEPAPASPHEVSHPLLLWTKQEAAEIRKLIEAEPWAKREFERSFPKGLKPEERRTIDNLFLYSVMGDKSCLELEKDKLRQFIGCPPYVKDSFDWQWHYVDHYQMVLRYDTLYDELTAGEQRGLLRTFWNLALFGIREERIRSVDGGHPRMASHILCSLMTRDKRIIQGIFETSGGFKSLIDSLMDGRLSPGAGNPYLRTLGHLLLWCRGCKRLGMDEMGFGYVGQGDGPGHSAGATMKRYVQGWIKLGFPAVPVAGGMPALPNVHMGDVGPCQMVPGYPAGATQMHKRWGTAHMNGPAPRMLGPFWFELAHAQWPDAGFDWVLAQMRLPADEKYYPSLFFNLDPVDPSEVKPFPVASYVAPERGFGMLRMEESPEYWSSPRPAAALQFALQYVHYVHDCFTLLHYVANRHPVYGRVRFGPHQGYAGGHPWQDSVRGHNGIVVDSMQIQPVDTGEHGSEHTQVRHHFAEHVKFLAIHAEPKDVMVRAGQYSKVRKKVRKALYPDTAVERVLCLTDEYMLDIIRCASDRERVYHWNHNPHGKPQYEDSKRWEPSDDLNGGKLWENMGGIQKKHGKSLKAGKFDLTDVRKCDMKSEPWRLRLSRGEKQPGVVIRMLGGQPTTVYCGVPLAGEKGEASGMTTTIAERKADKTAFVVLHEPCLGDARRIVAFERIHQNDSGVAVRIRGSETPAVNDRVLIAYAKGAKTPLTLGDKGELFTFQGYAHVRLTGKRVLVSGDLRKMRLTGTPSGAELIINGKPVAATVSGGVLLYEVPE